MEHAGNIVLEARQGPAPLQYDDGVSCGGTGDGSLEIESHELGVWGPKCRRDCGDEAETPGNI